MSAKVRQVEAMKDVILGEENRGLSVIFMETQRQSVKVVKAKSVSLQGMRARTRGNSVLRQVLIFFIFFIFAPKARKPEKHTKSAPNLLLKNSRNAL